ncbi:spinster family MFS transporter [Sphingomicrobium aestuariivivum]|uniref:spinster family MFS transporter n=1 Tax=Sphingomicrobium aestuariivivum TaxID=1582356 RepID=UPI001FD7089E|nr:MFS transporter [Sphingomicrobium aestuariivivum]MCJ8191215.1 MFS transporter [Sphingomicrobium aestuariivivum]
MASNTIDPAASRGPNPNVVLGMLLIAYIFNFLDRQILGILAQPIKDDLGLSDAQFGAVGGLAFALLYSFFGVPLAMLADRTNRSGVIAGAVAVWSGFTALCGTANSFIQLFLFRLGVGVGEAGGVAPSYALIADYFPPERRARALAIFSLGVPIGLGAGTVFGAYIAELVNWRVAFVVMGVAGILYAPIFKLVVKDKPRSHGAPQRLADLFAVFPLIGKKPSFWLLAFGASLSSLCGYGLAIWIPSVLMRSFDMSLIGAGQFMGSLLLIGGTIGVFMGGWLADRLGSKDRRWYAWLPAIAWLVTAPLYALGLLSENLVLVWALLLIPNALNILWLGPVTTAIQHIVTPPLRATASGAFLLINNLIGLGVGPLLIGAISDGLRETYGADSLRYAALAVLSVYLLAALLMVFAARRLPGDWVEEAAG